MRYISLIIIVCLVRCTSNAQPNELVLKHFDKKFYTIQHFYIFLEYEMIKFCSDSSGQAKFDKAIKKTEKDFNSRGEGDQKEYKILFSILNERIKEIKITDSSLVKGKAFIESRLNKYELDFIVNDQLLIERFDFNKRDMLHGYDECSVGKSMYLFLIYDPILYMNVLNKNKAISETGEVFIPFYCTLQDDGTPLSIRRIMQTNLINLLSKYKDKGLIQLRDQIKNCDLEYNNHD
jgi:hypothetical protein